MNTKKCWRASPKGTPQQSIHVRSIAGYWETRRSMLTTTSRGGPPPPWFRQISVSFVENVCKTRNFNGQKVTDKNCDCGTGQEVSLGTT
jgi:hypothetical protein